MRTILPSWTDVPSFTHCRLLVIISVFIISALIRNSLMRRRNKMWNLETLKPCLCAPVRLQFGACRELFFISFHHGTRGEWKTENIFRTKTADCFFGEQSFSPDYVKPADIQLFGGSEKRRQTGAGSSSIGVDHDWTALLYFQHNIL